MNLEIRSFAVELREDSSRQSPGRLMGTALTYGEQASDRAEVFEPDSLTWDPAGIIVNRQHARTSPIMRVVPEVRGLAVVIDAPLPDTQAGRDAAREVREGLFRGLSIEFRAVRQTYRDGIRYLSQAVLFACALVDTPSYTGSVAEVRRGKAVRWWR